MSHQVTDQQMLGYDFFADDKDCAFQCHTSRVVQTRTQHECLFHPDWRHPIPPGARARVDKALFDGRWSTFYSCAACHERWLREEGEL